MLKTTVFLCCVLCTACTLYVEDKTQLELVNLPSECTDISVKLYPSGSFPEPGDSGYIAYTSTLKKHPSKNKKVALDLFDINGKKWDKAGSFGWTIELWGEAYSYCEYAPPITITNVVTVVNCAAYSWKTP